MTFHEHVEDLTKHQIFHNGASYRFPQYGLAIHGMSVHGVCKLGCGVGSSLDEERILHRHPYPLLGTYLHGSGPSDLMFCTNQLKPKVEYKHEGSLKLLLYQRCSVPTYDELSHRLATRMEDLDQLLEKS